MNPRQGPIGPRLAWAQGVVWGLLVLTAGACHQAEPSPPAAAGPTLAASEPAPPVGQPSTAPPAVLPEEQVPQAMKAWRESILARDPDTVQALDDAFRSRPALFTGPLTESAATDPEERVRAFSTRVLGKLHAVDAIPQLRKALADEGENVRFNAVWALGELGDHLSTRTIARMQKKDPSPGVREQATQVLQKLLRTEPVAAEGR